MVNRMQQLQAERKRLTRYTGEIHDEYCDYQVLRFKCHGLKSFGEGLLRCENELKIEGTIDDINEIIDENRGQKFCSTCNASQKLYERIDKNGNKLIQEIDEELGMIKALLGKHGFGGHVQRLESAHRTQEALENLERDQFFNYMPTIEDSAMGVHGEEQEIDGVQSASDTYFGPKYIASSGPTCSTGHGPYWGAKSSNKKISKPKR